MDRNDDDKYSFQNVYDATKDEDKSGLVKDGITECLEIKRVAY